jgi:hypothetical protein
VVYIIDKRPTAGEYCVGFTSAKVYNNGEAGKNNQPTAWFYQWNREPMYFFR